MSDHSSPPTMDDIHTAVACLHALLWSSYEVSTGIQYSLPDGQRDDTAERLNSLIILARDEAERIVASIESCITAENKKARNGH